MPYHVKRALFVALVAAAFAVGCDREATDGGTASASAEASGQPPDSPETSASESSTESPLVAKSDELPDEPERLVSLAPNVTEMLFALGIGDRVVAVTSHCDYPETVTALPSVGSFANPDFETIVAKQPDLVVGVVSGGDRGVFERLKSVDIPYAFVRTDTIGETMRGLETIGRLVGRADKASSLAERIRTQLDDLRARWNDEARPQVLLVYGHEPLVAAGPGTFGHQLLEAAGAENVLADADTQYPRLDIEKVVELRPEIIVDTARVESPGDDEFWASHTAIEAVRRDRVRYLTDPVVLRPGPRLPEALRKLGRAIHGADGAGEPSGDGGDR